MTVISATLQQEISQLEANFCAALSDPTRLLILYALSESPHNVTELTVILGANQPTVSRHLKILRDRGVVRARRQGTIVTYELVDPRLIQALDLLRNIMRDRLRHHASLVDEFSE
ncbi:MAG: ArsR/SmtB family transcription factor [Anaerolineae bacterium]